LIGAVWIDCDFDIDVVYIVFEHLILPFIERFVDPQTIGTPPVKELMEVCHRRKCDGMLLT
jgi:dsRNA-specific ribonuclease